MADVVYQDPIEHLSGKISKKYRTCYNYRKTSKRKYTSVPGERTTPKSSDEVLARARFGAIGRAVQARRKNLSSVATDIANFRAQQDTGYKTFFQYLWHVCADAYDQSNG